MTEPGHRELLCLESWQLSKAKFRDPFCYYHGVYDPRTRTEVETAFTVSYTEVTRTSALVGANLEPASSKAFRGERKTLVLDAQGNVFCAYEEKGAVHVVKLDANDLDKRLGEVTLPPVGKEYSTSVAHLQLHWLDHNEDTLLMDVIVRDTPSFYGSGGALVCLLFIVRVLPDGGLAYQPLHLDGLAAGAVVKIMGPSRTAARTMMIGVRLESGECDVLEVAIPSAADAAAPAAAPAPLVIPYAKHPTAHPDWSIVCKDLSLAYAPVAGGVRAFHEEGPPNEQFICAFNLMEVGAPLAALWRPRVPPVTALCNVPAAIAEDMEAPAYGRPKGEPTEWITIDHLDADLVIRGVIYATCTAKIGWGHGMDSSIASPARFVTALIHVDTPWSRELNALLPREFREVVRALLSLCALGDSDEGARQTVAVQLWASLPLELVESVIATMWAAEAPALQARQTAALEAEEAAREAKAAEAQLRAKKKAAAKGGKKKGKAKAKARPRDDDEDEEEGCANQ